MLLSRKSITHNRGLTILHQTNGARRMTAARLSRASGDVVNTNSVASSAIAAGALPDAAWLRNVLNMAAGLSYAAERRSACEYEFPNVIAR